MRNVQKVVLTEKFVEWPTGRKFNWNLNFAVTLLL